MEIPYKELKPETLQAIISDFVLREGTDYGSEEISLEKKIDQVMKALKDEDAIITFDPKSESCTITTTEKSSLLSFP